MFDDEVHRKAMQEFISYLRTMTSQKNIAFFSDISREYVRGLGKGEKIPTVKVFCNMIEAAGLDLYEGARLYIDLLQQEQVTMVAERNGAANYLRNIKEDPRKSSR